MIHVFESTVIIDFISYDKNNIKSLELTSIDIVKRF